MEQVQRRCRIKKSMHQARTIGLTIVACSFCAYKTGVVDSSQLSQQVRVACPRALLPVLAVMFLARRGITHTTDCIAKVLLPLQDLAQYSSAVLVQYSFYIQLMQRDLLQIVVRDSPPSSPVFAKSQAHITKQLN
jgi:hypothetical protein